MKMAVFTPMNVFKKTVDVLDTNEVYLPGLPLSWFSEVIGRRQEVQYSFFCPQLQYGGLL
jgi:hypothetical protein